MNDHKTTSTVLLLMFKGFGGYKFTFTVLWFTFTVLWFTLTGLMFTTTELWLTLTGGFIFIFTALMFTFTLLWFTFPTPGYKETPTRLLLTFTVLFGETLVATAVTCCCFSEEFVPLLMPYTLFPIRSSVIGVVCLGGLLSAALIFSATCYFLNPKSAILEKLRISNFARSSLAQ